MAQGNALHTGGPASHVADVAAAEPDGDAVSGRQHHEIVVRDLAHHDELVVLTQAHGNKAALAAPGIERGAGALHHAPACGEEERLVLGEFAHGQDGVDPLVLFHGHEVGDMHALGRPAAVRHLMDLELVHTALVGEHQQELVVRRGDEFLHEIVFAGMHSGHALAATALLLVDAEARALDVATARKGDDHVVVGQQVFDVDVRKRLADNFRTAGRRIGLLDVFHFITDDAPEHGGVAKDGLVPRDL